MENKPFKIHSYRLYNLKIDFKNLIKKVKKLRKSIELNKLSKLAIGYDKRMLFYQDKFHKVVDKFHEKGGDYIYARLNGGFHERNDVNFTQGGKL